MQLKAKVRNLSKGNSIRAQTLIRNFIMERFLERISLSKYKDNFILKGGMLVAAVVGLDTRATMDIDTTIRSATLSMEQATKIITAILAVPVEDGVSFKIIRAADIMEEHDYPGIRFILKADLDRLKQVFKIDISTGDIITPAAVQYDYALMFENRKISLWSYNIETLLAEKLETIMTRGVTNTRMRDFYDIYVITAQKDFDDVVFKNAFWATSQRRGSMDACKNSNDILQTISENPDMKRQWENYAKDSFYVGNVVWDDVIESVQTLCEKIT